jgi:hypothetical protein
MSEDLKIAICDCLSGLIRQSRHPIYESVLAAFLVSDKSGDPTNQEPILRLLNFHLQCQS